MTPRSRPAPYALQVPKAVPMVPEVSLIFGDETSGIFTEGGPRQPPITHGKPTGVHHVQDFLSSTHQPLKYPPSSQNSIPGNHKLLSHAQSAPNLQQIRSVKQQQQCKLPCCADNKMMPNGRLAQNYLSNGTSQPTDSRMVWMHFLSLLTPNITGDP
uniref:Uncharacterized protein LOC111120586 n=1 Tax=Crassostrea virginica TaxID=6565 RepID=A0A8B8CMU8_CRAVI|nr:uncharacterized protein LOC111120586 [Crassostrea virginica]